MAPPNKNYYDDQDEIINITLPKEDYLILRDMIDRQRTLNWLGKYFRNIIFVAASGLLVLIAFGEQIKGILSKLLGG